MDPMQLAQLKRTTVWHSDEVHRIERNLGSAELALENAKKNVEDIKKKLVESKRNLERHNQDVINAEKEVRKQIASDRQVPRA